MTFGIFFVLGTISGSFFNVIIYRLPLEESIVKPRSHCPNCKKTIPFYRNIPILSFILQKGKCAECRKTISLQYPAVELTNGLIWGWAFSTMNIPDAVVSSLIISILITIAWIDAKLLMVPLDLIVAGIIVLITGAVGFNLFALNQILLGIVAGVFLPALIMGFTWLFTHRQGMGWGDLQLGLVLGAWLGPICMIGTLFLASFLGLIAWICISIVKGFDRNRPIPFAPYLVFSGVFIFVITHQFPAFFDQLILAEIITQNTYFVSR
tara:strand:- start:8558 stop:9355 length:798 start_codon:yes stop_codon:yes gene_type:complete